MLKILSQKHIERRQRIIIAAITIALAAQIYIPVITDGFILTLSLFILPVFCTSMMMSTPFKFALASLWFLLFLEGSF